MTLRVSMIILVGACVAGFGYSRHLQAGALEKTPKMRAAYLLNALMRGDYATFSKALPPGEEGSYGMSRRHLRNLFSSYLYPTYSRGVGKDGKVDIRTSENRDNSEAMAHQMYLTPPASGVRSSYKVMTVLKYRQAKDGTWGYWADLNTILLHAWLIRGMDAGDTSEYPGPILSAAKRDRAVLEYHKLTKFPSEKGESVTWEKHLARLARLAEKKSL